MSKINAFIEIHYYSGGLKSVFTGAEKRPEWLPGLDSVGLHNKVSPALGEYVVEFSRRKQGDKYITWIGVYSHGKDDQFGDRANYNGAGTWIVDAFPIHCSLIIHHLREICDLLVAQGPTADVKRRCIEVQNGLIRWISSIELLPYLDNGVVFDTTSHPETLYIRSDNTNNDINLQSVATSIERNCIVADKEFHKLSRVLYLLLDASVEVKNVGNVIPLPDAYSPTEDLINYFYQATETFKQDVTGFKNKISELESDLAMKSNKINDLANDKLQLEQDNAEKAKKINELELLSNTKSPKQLLDELKQSVIGSSIDRATKEKLVKNIEDLDSSRPIKLEVPQAAQDYSRYFTEIMRRLDSINGSSNKKEHDFLVPNEISEVNSIHILPYIVGSLVIVLVLYAGWKGYNWLYPVSEATTVNQVNIESPKEESFDNLTGKFTISAKPTVIKNSSELVRLSSNLEDKGVSYDVIFGGCKIADGNILSASSDNNHEICKVKARAPSGEEALISIDVDITSHNPTQKK